MKTISALILAVAALAAAVPNAVAPADAALVSRQSCTYSCGCQLEGDDGGIDPDTAKCCSNVSGTLGNEGSLCVSMPLATAQNYARCCGDSGGYVCFQSAPSCPPVGV